MFNLKLALRTLFRSPFVTAVAILSLGLGIGANAAIFSVFNQVLLKPLPVHEPGRLVNFASPGPKSGMTSCGNEGSCETIFSLPMFRDLEKQQTSFTGIAAHRSLGANLSYKNQSKGGRAIEVSGSYFQVLGLTAAAGRLIGPGDDRTAGESGVAVLSHRYWMSRFQGNSSVINDTLTINGQPFTIIGVAQEGFDGTTLGARADVFVPITMADLLQPGRNMVDNRRAYWLYLFARLKPGVTLESAKAAINQPYHAVLADAEAPLQKGMSAPTLERFKAKSIELTPGQRGQSHGPEEAFAPLVLLLCVTFVVLLSACANIANLLLAKAVGRSGEMAVRLSIGGARRHLIGQLLGESILLALFGGLFGIAVAQWTLAGMLKIAPSELGESLATTLDLRVFGFMAVVTLGTGLLFGLFPALHATRPNLATALKGQAGQPGGAKSARRFRATLATVQVVMSVALLAIAGLFVKSLVKVTHVDLGFNADRVVMFSIAPSLKGYSSDRSRQIYEQVEDALARVPGATSSAGAMVPLIGDDNWGQNVSVEGFAAGPDADTHSMLNAVSPGFFRTVGMRLLAGRDFTRADTMGAPKVAIVNEAFAKKFNLGSNPVGRRMASGRGSLDTEIVGLVKDAKYSGVKQEIPPVFFKPYRQDERTDGLVFYIATSGSTDPILSAIKPLLDQIDPDLPLSDVQTMADQIRANVNSDRLVSTLASVFAGLATLLAAVGLYGVLAYTVAQRTREIGLRMALGADATNIRGLVMKQIGKMTAIGGAIGLAIAIAVGIMAQSQLYQMRGFDPSVMAAAAGALTMVALVAGLIPAIRASRVDPMRALRYE